jgi:hypothetical protein
VYLKQKLLERLREHRKKEIIVERYEAKLKEEQEQLAYEVQRANEARQRNLGQREKQSSSHRGGRVSSFLLLLYVLSALSNFYDSRCSSCRLPAAMGPQSVGEQPPQTMLRLLFEGMQYLAGSGDLRILIRRA